MEFVIDLNPRQSARTLEQAIRHQVEVTVKPRVWPEDEVLQCALSARRAEKGALGRLVLTPVSRPASDQAHGLDVENTLVRAGRFGDLLGTYCDIAIQLGENQYYFSSDVVEVEEPHEPNGPCHLHLSVPEIIQVAQRRRYRRFQPARSSQVEIVWTRDGKPAGGGVGWLCNVSADGIACRTELRIADQLLIGEQVWVQFQLDPQGELFALQAILVAKTPAGSDDKRILGLQFLTGAGYESAAQTVRALRREIAQRYLSVGSRESAGA